MQCIEKLELIKNFSFSEMSGNVHGSIHGIVQHSLQILHAASTTRTDAVMIGFSNFVVLQ